VIRQTTAQRRFCVPRNLKISIKSHIYAQNTTFHIIHASVQNLKMLFCTFAHFDAIFCNFGNDDANGRCTKERKAGILNKAENCTGKPAAFRTENRAANSGLLMLSQRTQFQFKNAKSSTAVLGGIAGAVLTTLVVSPGGVLVGMLVLVRGLGAVGGAIAGVGLAGVLIRVLVLCVLGAVLAVVRAVFHDYGSFQVWSNWFEAAAGGILYARSRASQGLV
jgi:hypothetical protein